MSEQLKVLQKVLQQYLTGKFAHWESGQENRLICYAHMTSVSRLCVLLAEKRGVDPELAALAGQLHDVWTYVNLSGELHGERGAVLAGEILDELGLASAEERDAICQAIAVHSLKMERHGPLAEILIDADVLDHCLCEPGTAPAPHERERFERLRQELGF